jgi:hypothetical protein
MTGASAFRHEGALACEALEAAGLREGGRTGGRPDRRDGEHPKTAGSLTRERDSANRASLLAGYRAGNVAENVEAIPLGGASS